MSSNFSEVALRFPDLLHGEGLLKAASAYQGKAYPSIPTCERLFLQLLLACMSSVLTRGGSKASHLYRERDSRRSGQAFPFLQSTKAWRIPKITPLGDAAFWL